MAADAVVVPDRPLEPVDDAVAAGVAGEAGRGVGLVLLLMVLGLSGDGDGHFRGKESAGGSRPAVTSSPRADGVVAGRRQYCL